MRVIRARTAGFCMGVSLALRRLDTELGKATSSPGASQSAGEGCPQRLLTFGPIIHNPLVMEEYAAQGVGCEANVSQLHAGDRVVIRAHGIPRTVEQALREKDVSLVDATCPKVKRAQLAIAKQAPSKAMLLLFGEEEHPEVQGLLSYAMHGYRVFGHPDELAAYDLRDDAFYFLAAQTTQDRGQFETAAAFLKERLGERLSILDTICDATRQRQKETIELARQTDLVVVVGGRNSGNTRRLAEVARAEGVPAIHVEQAAELRREQFLGVATVGLTAGASTPEAHIDAVQKVLEDF